MLEVTNGFLLQSTAYVKKEHEYLHVQNLYTSTAGPAGPVGPAGYFGLLPRTNVYNHVAYIFQMARPIGSETSLELLAKQMNSQMRKAYN